jgi:TPR repeat protein
MANVNGTEDVLKLIEKAATEVSKTRFDKFVPYKEPRKFSQAKLQALTEAAESGELAAQLKLGECYLYGQKAAFDLELAEKYFKLAAAQNHAQAYLILAEINERKPRPSYNGSPFGFDGSEPILPDPNYVDPAILVQKAADMGCAEAQRKLGHDYLYKRIGGGEDGYDWVLRDGTEADHSPADIAKGWELVKKAAENGNTGAMLDMADRFECGFHTAPDLAEAAKWYKQMARAGSSAGCYRIGLWYAEGKGVKQNKEEAAKWFGKGAKKKNPGCKYRIGLCYKNGEGVEQNDILAFKWLLQAATEDFYAPAECEIGLFYYHGRVVNEDVSMAMKWWHRAAVNYAPARSILSQTYRHGDGCVEPDLEKAKYWEEYYSFGKSLQRDFGFYNATY